MIWVRLYARHANPQALAALRARLMLAPWRGLAFAPHSVSPNWEAPSMKQHRKFFWLVPTVRCGPMNVGAGRVRLRVADGAGFKP